MNSFSARGGGSGGGNLNKNFPKFKCPRVAWGGGGMLKLRFDWYIKSLVSIDITATALTSVLVQYDGAQTERL